MRRLFVILFALLLCVPLPACAEVRALLAACSRFSEMENLGNAVSGNLHMLGSALLGAGDALSRLSIADGTLGSTEALREAVQGTFGEAQDDDLSLFYLCTHGVITQDDAACLLLGDGENEALLSGEVLYDCFADIPGQKLLILDACHSGAVAGHPLSGNSAAVLSPFLADPSIHVLTSAGADESGWYYDSDGLSTGAVSYFASALASGLGLYGNAEADLSGDGQLTLDELHRYLLRAVPSSTCQLFSASAEALLLPIAQSAMLSRPLNSFSFGASLLTTDEAVLDFAFTASSETAVQYRLIEYSADGWLWNEAQAFADEGDLPDGLLLPGRKSRSLTLSGIAPEDSGWLMLQVFSVTEGNLLLCAERLIGVQPANSDAAPEINCPAALPLIGAGVPIAVHIPVPAELTVTIYDTEGLPVRRLARCELTHPDADGIARFIWDGRDTNGQPVPEGEYAVAAEAVIGGKRRKTLVPLTVTPAEAG